jgi:hypothetical protein
LNYRTISSGFIVLLAAAALLAGCGGGGEGEGEAPQSQAPTAPGTASVFSWTPPVTFSDNTPMNPVVDIDYYELYLRPDGNFTDSDQPAAQIAAIVELPSADGRSVVQSSVTEFTLEQIPSLPAGDVLYVSMRAVGIDKQKSAFMFPVLWERS